MSQFEVNRRIAAPIDAVFGLMTSTERAGEWQSGLVEAQVLTPGPLRPGWRAVIVQHVAGQHVRADSEVLDYDPPRRMRVRGLAGPITFIGDYHCVEGSGGETLVGCRVDVQVHGLYRVALPAIAGAIHAQYEADFTRLKQVLETGG